MFKSNTSDLRYDHEDEVNNLFDDHQLNGETPIYIFMDSEDEAIFVSSTPITLERIKREFPNDALYITDMCGDDE